MKTVSSVVSLTPTFVTLAEPTVPDPLDTVFLVNSGSEANESAMHLAVLYWSRGDSARAAEHIAQAARLDPHNPDVIANATAISIAFRQLAA